MPSFTTHRRTNYLLFIIASAVAYYQYGWFDWAIMTWLAIGFYVGTDWVTPDLDTDSYPYHGHGKLWQLICLPYKTFWHHRSQSHRIFSGIVWRLIYFLIILSAIVLIANYLYMVRGGSNELIAEFVQFLNTNYRQILIMFGGLAAANAIHIIADKVT
jgi:uncharacterized metal-binding protein